MSEHASVVERGRAALLAGDLRLEGPPVNGQPRWGLATLLRPDPSMLAAMAALGARASAAAGGGHWAHGTDGLHVSLVPLLCYESVVSEISRYASAVRDAVDGVPAAGAQVRTVSPHPGGVAVHVHPADETLDRLELRLRQVMAERGLAVLGNGEREVWYSNVVHFAGPVDVPNLIDWSDRHRGVRLGHTVMSTVELVRYDFTGAGMRAVCLKALPLNG